MLQSKLKSHTQYKTVMVLQEECCLKGRKAGPEDRMVGVLPLSGKNLCGSESRP